jgi:purine-binding chemotaxis protein CheW
MTDLSAERAIEESRTLRLIRAGTVVLGVFEDEVAATAPWRAPTPLPDAPPAILGVVSLEGRMLTVLDSLKLLGRPDEFVPRQILGLRGEEQLALAVEDASESLEVKIDELIAPEQSDVSPVAGIIGHQGSNVLVLDTERLFVAAFQGRERRRRRS